MNKLTSFFWETVKIVAVALAIVIPIRYFLFQPFLVKGESMEPNFQNGDYLIVDEISYRLRQPERGEVVVFKFPLNPSQKFIKRIIGLPGETVEIKGGKITVYKDGKAQILAEKYIPVSFFTAGDVDVRLGSEEYFVMGDNRDFSYDSRKFGKVSANEIIGRVVLRAWPFVSFSEIKIPSY